MLLDDSMDSRFGHFCRMLSSTAEETSAPLTDEMQKKLRAVAFNRPRTGLRVYLEGSGQCGQTEAVAVLASTWTRECYRQTCASSLPLQRHPVKHYTCWCVKHGSEAPCCTATGSLALKNKRRPIGSPHSGRLSKKCRVMVSGRARQGGFPPPIGRLPGMVANTVLLPQKQRCASNGGSVA